MKILKTKHYIKMFQHMRYTNYAVNFDAELFWKISKWLTMSPLVSLIFILLFSGSGTKIYYQKGS